MLPERLRRGTLGVLGLPVVLGLAAGVPGPGPAHGSTALLHADQSSNWAGYVVGAVDHATPFTSIFAQWRVPTATGRSTTDAEYSATWIGIGGGCADADCAVSDPATLIQTGTEQDVVDGHAEYSAWWETIPETSTTISSFVVEPGDLMSASVTAQSVVDEAGHGVANGTWVIRLLDVSRRETFQTSVDYADSELSAEWITETPLIVGGGGTGVATLPNLRGDAFTNVYLNGARFSLSPSEEMVLEPSTEVLALPSAPGSTHSDFNVCTYTTGCASPR